MTATSATGLWRQVLAACGVLLLLAACAPQTGGPTTDQTQGDNGGDGTGGDTDPDYSGGGGGPADPCTLIPDDALAQALGSAPSPDRTPQPDSGAQLCVIEGTGEHAVLSIQVSPGGRDTFELYRSYKEGIEDLYQELTGLGDDAFGFGKEVTVLIGDQVVVFFLEGLSFDLVPQEEMLEKTKQLALIAVDRLD